MNIKETPQGNVCGCCEAPVQPTPQQIQNRPGLSTISYRIGTYASFREAMIEDIAHAPELRGWAVRSNDDYGIALLDMWAYLGDILTFYQERIANEAFLRTAVLRESVLRLAALLDYKPAPGVAASTYLAFTLEKGKQVKIPIGLRAQSVPGQNEKPQKFETIEAINATALLNKVRVYPQPKSIQPFIQKATEAILKPSTVETIATAVTPGDFFVLFSVGNTDVEEKQVSALRTEDQRTYLSWTPAVRQAEWHSAPRAFKFRRKLRLFGYNAPSQYLQISTDTKLPGGIKWEVSNREYTATGPTLSLDSRYDDLQIGTKLLLYTAKEAPKLLTITTISQGQVKLKPPDPFSDNVTSIKVTDESNSDYKAPFDCRTTILYELADPEIDFWGLTYEPQISGNIICTKMEDLAAVNVTPGQRLILADDNGTIVPVTVSSVEDKDYDKDGKNDHLVIAFTPPLTSNLSLDSKTAVLYGNVAQATHGETVTEEALGNGDASTGFQSFPLKKSPVTFVSKPGAPRGAASTLQVRVDGVLWHEVDTLYGRKSDERMYTSSVDNEGVMTVQFGNGSTGARLPSGRNNVVAIYRQGLGGMGNVKANVLTTLLDRPVGLKSVTNPAAATGGANAETLEEARTNAPNTVHTFGRIVSLRDFEDAALEFTGIAKARATWKWVGGEQVVYLTLAGEMGTPISNSTLQALVDDLNSRRDRNRRLVASDYRRVPVQVEAAIKVAPDYLDTDVLASANKALEDHFAFDNLNLGQPIHLSDIYRVLQDVEGVMAVDMKKLQFIKKPPLSMSDVEYKQFLRRHGAKFHLEGGIEVYDPVQSQLRIDAGELAVIEQTDAKLSVGMRQI